MAESLNALQLSKYAFAGHGARTILRATTAAPSPTIPVVVCSIGHAAGNFARLRRHPFNHIIMQYQQPDKPEPSVRIRPQLDRNSPAQHIAQATRERPAWIPPKRGPDRGTFGASFELCRVRSVGFLPRRASGRLARRAPPAPATVPVVAPAPPQGSGRFTLIEENDAFAYPNPTDRWYTQGLELNYLSAPIAGTGVAAFLPSSYLDPGSFRTQRFELVFGQAFSRP